MMSNERNTNDSSESSTAKEEVAITNFKESIQRIRDHYYTRLDILMYKSAQNVLELGSSFRGQVLGLTNTLFRDLEIPKGVSLVSSGSFARSNHVEGSDFDWYLVSRGTSNEEPHVEAVQRALMASNVRCDNDILPIPKQRWDGDMSKPHDDWGWGDSGNRSMFREGSSRGKCGCVTLEEANKFYESDPFAYIGKIVGTLDIMHIAGDRAVTDEHKKLCATQNSFIRWELIDKLTKQMEGLNERYPRKIGNNTKIDIKEDRGMIFHIHHIFWLLELLSEEFDQHWEENTIESRLEEFMDQEYLTEHEWREIVTTLSVYLVIRNHIVRVAAEKYAHPTGYEQKYDDFIANEVAERMGFSTPQELENVISKHADGVVGVADAIAARVRRSMSP